MKLNKLSFLWITTLLILVIQSLRAYPTPPVTVVAYFSGSLFDGETITFSGAGSYDTDNCNLGYTPYWRWNFNYNGTTFVEDLRTTSAYPTWVYQQAGTYTVAVIYYDNDGQQGDLKTFTVQIAEKHLYPKLLFKGGNDVQRIQANFNLINTFPYKSFHDYLVPPPASDFWRNSPPTNTTGDADYDRSIALYAKVLAFRYMFNGQQAADGDLAYYYLYELPASNNYSIDPSNNRWMTNGLALIDYCVAFDILAGSGYLNKYVTQSMPLTLIEHNIQAPLVNRANLLYQRAKVNDWTVDEFLSKYIGSTCKDVPIVDFWGIHWTVKVCGIPTTNQDVYQDAIYHSQSGNMRIIVASALGVAAYALNYDPYASPAPPTQDWLSFAQKDVGQFLLNNNTYGFPIQSQNVNGMFPEGTEYFNYSAQGFVPFFIADNVGGGGGNYWQNQQFQNILDWCYDVQLPTGEAPQINSSGRAPYNSVWPSSSLFSSTTPSGANYLWQLQTFTQKTTGGVDLPVEGYCLINSQTQPLEKAFSISTVKPTEGQVIFRDNTTTPTKYLLISAKNGAARWGGGTHEHAEAGSFIFSDGNKTLVRQPGYSGAESSADYEKSLWNNTICPIVGDTISYDATDRLVGLPPCTDTWINQTANTANFDFANVSFDLNGSSPGLGGDVIDGLLGLAYNGAGSQTFEYLNTVWMQSKANLANNMSKYGDCIRRFLMVNNSYVVVRDDITNTSSSPTLQGVVSIIHGNNGDNYPKANFAAGTNIAPSGEVTWQTDPNTSILRVNTAALGGKYLPFSGLVSATHSNSTSGLVSGRAPVYHAALYTGCQFNANNQGQIISIVESDPNSTTRSSITTKINTDTDPFLLYTIDGRGKTYGRYDIVFSQGSVANATIGNVSLPYSIKTDASFLIMSFDGSNLSGISPSEIFSCNASYIIYGTTLILPNNTGDAQTSFSIGTVQNPSAISAFTDDPAAFSRNSQRKFIQTIVNGTRWLHQTYTSRGHVWIEHSSDGGNTWVVGNNGQPIDNGGGKCPSIAFSTLTDWGNNYIGVVWEQPSGSNYTIQGELFNQISGQNGIPTGTGPATLYTETSDSYSTNANPNIIIDHTTSLVTFERKGTGGGQAGINWLVSPFAEYTGGQEYAMQGASNGAVSNTDASSTNATISLNPYYSNDSKIDVDMIYQEGSAVRYAWLDFDNSGLNQWQFTQSTPSAIGYNAPSNYNPSIISFPNGEFAASWIINLPGNEDGSWGDVDNMEYYYSGNPWTSWSFGSGVQSCSLNGGGDNSGFTTWSQIYNGSWSNKSIRFLNYSPNGSTLQNLNTTGKYVQLANSTSGDISNMYLSSFYPFSFPYYINTSTQLGPLNKGASDLVLGRGCIINNGDVSFCYLFEGLNVDGTNIAFLEAPDTLDYSKVDILNSVLVSNPFLLNDNSKVVFTERSGFPDSASAARILGNGGYVGYRIDLIDNSTEKVIGPIKNLTLNSSNIQTLKDPSFSLSTKGLGNRTVRVKVTIATNLFQQDTAAPLKPVSPSSLPHRGNLHPKIMLLKSLSGGNETSNLNKTSMTVLGLDLPTTYDLSQNYPNPFNPTTTINYQIPKDGRVLLKVFDVLGREAITLVDDFRQTGRYSVQFDASRFSSGVYFYSIRSGEYTTVKKMLLIK